MSDMMTFPDTWEEFEKSYGFTDNEEVYTNGSRLIPSFRVKQWLDHLLSKEPLFKFMMDHPDMGLIINYDPVLKGISFTMDVYPTRKKIVLYLEEIEKLSLDSDSIVLEYLENMYKELAEYNKEEK